MNQYKFFIPYFLSEVEVFPLYDKLKFKYQKIEGTKIFSKKLTTNFTFKNNPASGISDFSFLYSIETNSFLRCTYAELIIRKSCDGGKSYSEYYRGRFTMNGGNWDLERCTFETEVEINDKYTCLLNAQNEEVNLVLSGPLITIKNTTQFNYEFYYCDISGVSQPVVNPFDLRICFTSPTAEEATWTDIYNDIECYDFGCTGYVGNLIIYARERVLSVNIGGVSSPPSGGGWVMVPGSNNGETTTYVRPYSGTLPVITNTIVQVACGGVPTLIGGLSYLKLFFKNLDNTCTSQGEWYWSPPSGATKTYTQFRTLYNSINYLAHQICPDINNIVSDFFEWNPIGDAPGYIAGKNYVTGLDNALSKIAIAQKSDVIDPTASSHATIGKTTFKKLMNWLRDVFNVYYILDANNNLRIEHDSFFEHSLGYDTTMDPHTKFNSGNKKYSYAKEEMPSREIFKFMEAQSIDFVGKDIVYSGACVSRNPESGGQKEYNTLEITTDINFIENQPSDIEKHGFVIVVYEVSGSDLFIAKEEGLITGTSIVNGHLSWANLHYNYHRHGRILLSGNMNGANETFFSSVRSKIQNNVKFQICCNDVFDPQGKLITTSLGNGEFVEGEEQNNIITMTIAL